MRITTVTFIGGPGHLRRRDVLLRMGRVWWYPGGVDPTGAQPYRGVRLDRVCYHAREVRPGVWYACPDEWTSEDFQEAFRRYEGGQWR